MVDLPIPPELLVLRENDTSVVLGELSNKATTNIAALLAHAEAIAAALSAEADAIRQLVATTSATLQAADATLQTNLNSEVTARTAAVQAEATARTNAVSSLTTTVNGKAAATHDHAITDTTGLRAELDNRVTFGLFNTLSSQVSGKAGFDVTNALAVRLDNVEGRLTNAGW